MTGNKLVSVLMPVYHDVKFLRQSIDSILCQTYKNMELLLLVSRNSDDGSAVICEEYADRYHNVRILTQKNTGISDALNLGIAASSGDYIARMDADDIALPERLEKQVRFLDGHQEVDVVGSAVMRIDEKGRQIGKVEMYTEDEDIKATLIFGNGFFHPTVMFRSRVFQGRCRYQNVLVEDARLWMDLSFDYKFANLPEVLLLYRKHPNSITAKRAEEIVLSRAESAYNFVQKKLEWELGKYCVQDFVRTGSEERIEETMEDFLSRQAELLKDLTARNQQCNAFAQNALRRECEMRQKWLSRILSGKKLLEMKKNVVIYGYGMRGKKIIEKLKVLNERMAIHWNLCAVIDKRAPYMQKEELPLKEPVELLAIREQVDLILVSSQIYDKEITEELCEMGIEKSKIISCDWIFHL